MHKNKCRNISQSPVEHGAIAKYVNSRCKMAYFHGCHGYHGNSCQAYKENIEFISKQTFLLINSYHQVHGFHGVIDNYKLLRFSNVYLLEKYSFLNTV